MIVMQILEMRKRTSMDKLMIGFSTILVLMNTVYWTTQAYFGEKMWIEHSDYPGGSDAYWKMNNKLYDSQSGWVTKIVVLSKHIRFAVPLSILLLRSYITRATQLPSIGGRWAF